MTRVPVADGFTILIRLESDEQDIASFKILGLRGRIGIEAILCKILWGFNILNPTSAKFIFVTFDWTRVCYSVHLC